MDILKGLREIWLGVSNVKDKSVGSGSVSVKNTDRVDAKNMEVVFAEDSVVVEEKLDEILNRLGQNDDKHRVILLDFLYDVVNRESQIYSNFSSNPNFIYSMSINDDVEKHHFEVLFNGKKGMVIDVKSTRMGEILSFETKYRSDISEYLIDRRELGSNSNLGTTDIKIDCPLDGVITLEDKIYSLDLLNGSNYSNEVM